MERIVYPVNCDHCCIKLLIIGNILAKLIEMNLMSCGSSSNLPFLTLSKCLRLLSYPDLSNLPVHGSCKYGGFFFLSELCRFKIHMYYTDDN